MSSLMSILYKLELHKLRCFAWTRMAMFVTTMQTNCWHEFRWAGKRNTGRSTLRAKIVLSSCQVEPQRPACACRRFRLLELLEQDWDCFLLTAFECCAAPNRLIIIFSKTFSFAYQIMRNAENIKDHALLTHCWRIDHPSHRENMLQQSLHFID